MTVTVLRSEWRELNSRESDGIDVVLQLSAKTGEVRVVATDHRLGDEHVVENVPPWDTDRAFQHPYTYVAPEDWAEAS